MKLYNSVAKTLSILVAGAILMATPLMAENKSKTVYLFDTTINGTMVKEGDYRVKFSSTEAGEATISRNGKVVVKARYTLETLPEKVKRGGIYYRTNSEGGRELTRIIFDGYDVAVVFE